MLHDVIYVQKRDLANPMLIVLQFVSNKEKSIKGDGNPDDYYILYERS